MTQMGKEEKWMYFKYLWTVLRHKWFVFLASLRLGIPIRGLLHDLSKFRLSEFVAYARNFNSTWGHKFNGGFAWEHYRYVQYLRAFDKAWLLHQHRNPHHWQYWVLIQDDDLMRPVQMPERVAREMVADWMGAGRAYGGNWPEWPKWSWFDEHWPKLVSKLHPKTQVLVQDLVRRAFQRKKRL